MIEIYNFINFESQLSHAENYLATFTAKVISFTAKFHLKYTYLQLQHSVGTVTFLRPMSDTT